MKIGNLVVVACLCGLACANAAEKLTIEQIRQLMAATDAAASRRDTAAIGACLSRTFARNVDLSDTQPGYSFTVDREHYLSMIDAGWKKLDDYEYKRDDTSISVAEDGLSAQSRSTITEETRTGGRRSVARTREYAEYAIEDGKPVITSIESFDLVVGPGDTSM